MPCERSTAQGHRELSAAQDQELDPFDALDLPPELHELQDRCWGARRDWQALDAAYRLVLADILKRREANSRVY